MNLNQLTEALAQYLCVIIVITLHEFGHAWMAMRCGDDTAKSLGRVSLNPLAHIDMIGTVALPLIAIFLSLSGYGQVASFIIGWGKPVPVNYNNLRNVDRDSLLVAMAGPAMNVVLTVIVAVVSKLAMLAGWVPIGEACVTLATISMYLFFFNLIPVPPLDGSHILRFITRMRWETFFYLSQFGFIAVIILIQLPLVRSYLWHCTAFSVVSLFNVLQVGV
jgi:Zn-dependent protease